MNTKMKNYQSKLSIFTLALLVSLGAQAADVASTYIDGDTLTATKMTEIKDAVNSKQNQVTGTCPANQVIQEINTNGTVVCGNVTGVLIDSFVANTSGSLDAVIGYYNIRTNYVPSVDAKIHIFARCTLDSSIAGEDYAFRVAYRTPTVTGTPVTGSSFYVLTSMSTANASVMQVNNDFFNLNAGQSYDFGVNFFSATPPTGTNTDYCTITAMVFSR